MFDKNKKLDTWLAIAFGYLFQRSITDFDLMILKRFITNRQKAQDYTDVDKADHKMRSNLNSEWIGADGYLYKRKVLSTPPCKNPQETRRLENLLSTMRSINEMNWNDD